MAQTEQVDDVPTVRRRIPDERHPLDVFRHDRLPRWALVRHRFDRPRSRTSTPPSRSALRPCRGRSGAGSESASRSAAAGIDRIAEVVAGRRGGRARPAARSRSWCRRWAATAARRPRASSRCSPRSASPRRRSAARSGRAWTTVRLGEVGRHPGVHRPARPRRGRPDRARQPGEAAHRLQRAGRERPARR